MAADAFPHRSSERPIFTGNVSAVPAAASVRVEISWEVSYRQLTFRKDGDWYRARYDVSAVFLSNGRQIGGDVWERRVRERTSQETRAVGAKSRGRKILELPPGDYEVRLKMTDRHSNATSQVQGKLNARFDRSGIGLSDLRFVRYREGVATMNPGHDLALGDDGHVLRVQVYPAPGVSGECRLEVEIRDSAGERVVDLDSTVTVGTTPLLVEFPLRSDSMSIGENRVVMRVRGPNGGTDKREATLTVHLTAGWFVTRRERAAEVFHIIADDDEWKRLDGASEAEWMERVAEFWQGRDPSPGSIRNEYRDEIQQRMEAAASLFVEPFQRPGWKTDRGRVLLQYGVPSRRARHSADFDRPASEVWEYESPRRTFLFIDIQGSGEFWLRG